MNRKKSLIFAVIGILLVSSLALAVDAAMAMPQRMANIVNKIASASWVRINGNINLWGTTTVHGQLQTQAKAATLLNSDTKELTSAIAIWTANTSRPIQSVRAKENFTYVFYVARIPNASISTASVSAGSYFLNGTWNFAKVTSIVTIMTNDEGTITHIHRDQDVSPMRAYGELSITGNQFTLKINGIDQLSGSVYSSITRSWFNPFKVTDDSSSDVVTTSDVHAVAQCYGAMPGWGNYDTRMDFNNNFRVDIADICTVAANT
jgi:hypothetical protein